MPPKNKNKRPEKGRKPILINGLTKEEISKEELQEQVVHVSEELNRERDDSNYFQQRREKFSAFGEIAKRQLEDDQAQQNNLEKDMEEDERCHQADITICKMKIKHLLHDHQNTILEMKAAGLVCSEVMHKGQDQLESELHKTLSATLVDMQELDIENIIKELELKHDEEIIKRRNQWEKELTEMKLKKRMEPLHQKLNRKGKHCAQEMEELLRCDCFNHIAALTQDHNKAHSEATALVHGMQKDVETSDSLKKQIDDIEMKEEKKKMELDAVLKDNKHLDGQLLNMEAEIVENDRKQKYYTILKTENTSMKAKKNELRYLQLEHEALEQKFTKLQLDRDEQHKAFTQTVQMAQRHKEEKIEMLKKRLKTLTDNVKKMQTQLDAFLSASDIDCSALNEVTTQFQKIHGGNKSIKNVQFSKPAQKDVLLT